MFAVTLIALGTIGAIKGNFGAIWQPVPRWLPGREGLAYLCAAISLGSGITLLMPRTAALGARTLLACLLLWLLLFRLPVILRGPTVEVSWEGCGETAVLAAGAWVLYALAATDWDKQHFGHATGEQGVRIGRTIYGVAMIPFGLAHIIYVKETAALVPDWLPSPLTWAYVTGCTYLAASFAVLVGVYARLATALSALQMGLFTLFVWVPIVATNADAFQWTETGVSWALTAAAWVVADSYVGAPWFVVGKHRRPR
ncbi:MAG TPA: DoxX family protein [Casimicrobiaceae bacterium]|nr:DoxX family protein [Casimicrobiaceae bacterium]